MITVHEAETIILDQYVGFGTEYVHFEAAMGRVLAEDILCDRELPPYDRVTMDGIALKFDGFNHGLRNFAIRGSQAAGDLPLEIFDEGQCIEIMTGAALPASTDTVIRYEDIKIENGVAAIDDINVKKGQNVHYKGRDRKQNDIVAKAGNLIDSSVISIAATVGKAQLLVKKNPKVIIVSTGDELVDVNEQPTAYQVRRSNSYTIKAALEQFQIHPDLLHMPDDQQIIETKLASCLETHDVIILSGGVSMGKYDYLPAALKKLEVTELFHKVKQRPGKPFWFGKNEAGKLIFAFPGNPVSAFLCLHRYFVPWLELSLGLLTSKKVFAILGEDVQFTAPLTYFMQVKTETNEAGHLIAYPAQGNGSGDLANLLDTNAFMELPAESTNFIKGTVYRIWPYKRIL